MATVTSSPTRLLVMVSFSPHSHSRVIRPEEGTKRSTPEPRFMPTPSFPFPLLSSNKEVATEGNQYDAVPRSGVTPQSAPLAAR
jgi:hypothetical protein